MKPHCPNPNCSQTRSHAQNSKKTIVRNGTFYRHSDSRSITRYRCKSCGLNFSRSTLSLTYRFKKRRMDHLLNELLCSGVSQRRAARILKVNPKTVVRHFRVLALKSQINHELLLKEYRETPLTEIQFDDLETSEHTKCKPISVSLAVDPKTRKIIGFQASRMPAKGLLARKSFLKYGKRHDERPKGWNQLFKDLKPLVTKTSVFTSDENPHYKKHLKAHHPDALHVQVKGGRGCISGQGELKKLHFDPLFSLNHTCAMLRANMNRLFRRTWCTTKNIQGLIDHLWLYVSYHNQFLTPQISSSINGGS